LGNIRTIWANFRKIHHSSENFIEKTPFSMSEEQKKRSSNFLKILAFKKIVGKIAKDRLIRTICKNKLRTICENKHRTIWKNLICPYRQQPQYRSLAICPKLLS
jgi:hypothetical protein